MTHPSNDGLNISLHTFNSTRLRHSRAMKRLLPLLLAAFTALLVGWAAVRLGAIKSTTSEPDELPERDGVLALSNSQVESATPPDLHGCIRIVGNEPVERQAVSVETALETAKQELGDFGYDRDAPILVNSEKGFFVIEFPEPPHGTPDEVVDGADFAARVRVDSTTGKVFEIEFGE